MEGKQLFRQDDRFNGDTFLEFLKTIDSRFPKCHLFMDKASPHYRSRKVRQYFEENKDTMIPVYLPTASPEFMVMEEIWNYTKQYRQECNNIQYIPEGSVLLLLLQVHEGL